MLLQASLWGTGCPGEGTRAVQEGQELCSVWNHCPSAGPSALKDHNALAGVPTSHEVPCFGVSGLKEVMELS